MTTCGILTVFPGTSVHTPAAAEGSVWEHVTVGTLMHMERGQAVTEVQENVTALSSVYLVTLVLLTAT
jgi:hypothetical protein